MTHDLAAHFRPAINAVVLALGMVAASHSQAVNLVNGEGIKPSFAYMPMVGESQERVIAKTMRNSEVKLEIPVETFKALNPSNFSQDGKSPAKSNTALRIPNQNQLANMVWAQLGDKQIQLTSTSAQALADAKAQELKAQAKGLLTGTKRLHLRDFD